jgi:plastocyanin
MIWRWLICSSLLALAAAPPPNGRAPRTVSGRVALADSRDPQVRRQKNYSGVVVWLEPNGKAPVPHPAPQRAQMLQKGKRFIPHVLAIPVGGTVDFPNLDPIFHNAFSNFSGQPFDVGLYAPGTSQAVTFRHAGFVRVFCNIHSTMSAVIAVLRTPWFAVSDAAGAFRIDGVPPGEYRLQVFHERALPETLRAFERRIAVGPEGLEMPPFQISETGFILAPHLNKYGRKYPPLLDEKTYPGAR